MRFDIDQEIQEMQPFIQNARRGQVLMPTTLTLILSLSWVIGFGAFASGNSYEDGCEPYTRDEVHDALCSRDREYFSAAMYRAVEKRWTEMVPCLRKAAEELDPAKEGEWKEWGHAMIGLLHLDAHISQEEVAHVVSVARGLLSEDESEEAANSMASALLHNAHKVIDIDIKEDLLWLAHPGRLRSTGPSLIEDLFESCGKDLTPIDIEELRYAWRGSSREAKAVQTGFALYDLGYPPTKEGLRKVLATRDNRALPLCFSYLLATGHPQLTTEIRSFESGLAADARESSLNCSKFLLMWDDQMLDEERERRHNDVFARVLEGDGDLSGYDSLLEANELRDLCIKQDLIRLARPGKPFPDMKEKIITDLFERYRNAVNAQERAELKRRWEGNDRVLALIASLETRYESTLAPQRDCTHTPYEEEIEKTPLAATGK